MDPLALLAQDASQFGTGEGRQQQQAAAAAAAAAAEGLDTGIHASVADRAAAARAVMLQRDRRDRQELRELRKQQRQEKRVGRQAGGQYDGMSRV